jgi:hypothetical protein
MAHPHIPLSANRVLSLYEGFQAHVFYSQSALLHLDVQPIAISLNNHVYSSTKHNKQHSKPHRCVIFCTQFLFPSCTLLCTSDKLNPGRRSPDKEAS